MMHERLHVMQEQAKLDAVFFDNTHEHPDSHAGLIEVLAGMAKVCDVKLAKVTGETVQNDKYVKMTLEENDSFLKSTLQRHDDELKAFKREREQRKRRQTLESEVSKLPRAGPLETLGEVDEDGDDDDAKPAAPRP